MFDSCVLNLYHALPLNPPAPSTLDSFVYFCTMKAYQVNLILIEIDVLPEMHTSVGCSRAMRSECISNIYGDLSFSHCGVFERKIPIYTLVVSFTHEALF